MPPRASVSPTSTSRQDRPLENLTPYTCLLCCVSSSRNALHVIHPEITPTASPLLPHSLADPGYLASARVSLLQPCSTAPAQVPSVSYLDSDLGPPSATPTGRKRDPLSVSLEHPPPLPWPPVAFQASTSGFLEAPTICAGLPPFLPIVPCPPHPQLLPHKEAPPALRMVGGALSRAHIWGCTKTRSWMDSRGHSALYCRTPPPTAGRYKVCCITDVSALH